MKGDHWYVVDFDNDEIRVLFEVKRLSNEVILSSPLGEYDPAYDRLPLS